MLATAVIVAATKPAMSRPTRLRGTTVTIRVGYTRSACGMCGRKMRAHVPGNTIRKSTGSFSRPANNAPVRPWSRSLADKIRWTMT